MWSVTEFDILRNGCFWENMTLYYILSLGTGKHSKCVYWGDKLLIYFLNCLGEMWKWKIRKSAWNALSFMENVCLKLFPPQEKVLHIKHWSSLTDSFTLTSSLAVSAGHSLKKRCLCPHLVSSYQLAGFLASKRAIWLCRELDWSGTTKTQIRAHIVCHCHRWKLSLLCRGAGPRKYSQLGYSFGLSKIASVF